jgi:hypothetical protein
VVQPLPHPPLPSLHSTFKTIEESLRQDNQRDYSTRNSTLTNNYDQIHQYFNRSRQPNHRTLEHTLSLIEIAKQDSLEKEGEEMNLIHALQLGETDHPNHRPKNHPFIIIVYVRAVRATVVELLQ